MVAEGKKGPEVTGSSAWQSVENGLEFELSKVTLTRLSRAGLTESRKTEA